MPPRLSRARKRPAGRSGAAADLLDRRYTGGVLRAFATLTLLLTCGLAGACSSDHADKRCKDVCRREAQCVDGAGLPAPSAEGEQNRFDQAECAAACSTLLRDSRGKELVEKHLTCVEKAGEDCEKILACE